MFIVLRLPPDFSIIVITACLQSLATHVLQRACTQCIPTSSSSSPSRTYCEVLGYLFFSHTCFFFFFLASVCACEPAIRMQAVQRVARDARVQSRGSDTCTGHASAVCLRVCISLALFLSTFHSRAGRAVVARSRASTNDRARVYIVRAAGTICVYLLLSLVYISSRPSVVEI